MNLAATDVSAAAGAAAGSSGAAAPASAEPASPNATSTVLGRRRARTADPGAAGGADADGRGAGWTALARAVDYLTGLQQPDGHWRGLLETNVTMDAEDLFMRQFLGIRTAEQTAATARWIRSQQRPDGSWSNFRGGPGDVSTTAEAYIALKLAGDDPDAAHMAAARGVVLAGGGLGGTRVFTRMWMALFGLWDWRKLPSLPPEIIFLPKWFPLNLYDFGCWARQTIAPLTILSALQPTRELGVTVDELLLQARPRRRIREVLRGARSGGPSVGRTGGSRAWAAAFRGLDRVLHGYQRLPVQPLRRTAIRRIAEWVIARQEADGSWGGIQPPWVYSLMALSELGYANDHPVMARGLQGWERFTVHLESPDGPVRWVEACQSPVWDTALATVALADAAAAGTGSSAAASATRWLLREEISVTGDWAVRRPRLAPGGWAFEYDNDGYPDIDDTAEVVLGLRKAAGLGDPEVDAAIRRGIDWVVGMQSSDGGWAAFDADNTRELAYQLPFCDFGAVIDPPSADVTAHVVEMLAVEGLSDSLACRRGVRWLLRAQEPDGSWFGRWGANYLYGTGAVVPALVTAGTDPGDPVIRRAVDFLIRVQNEDGGWGEDLRSYTDRSWSARGASTASQTAWALLALHAAGESGSPAAARGVAWLAATQRPDGGWDEPEFTGTGFPGDFYINYHLYRVVFPVSALARCLAATGGPT
jgi:squalene-hopene/tetraprenyl-beta-curcumene cyclase